MAELRDRTWVKTRSYGTGWTVSMALEGNRLELRGRLDGEPYHPAVEGLLWAVFVAGQIEGVLVTILESGPGRYVVEVPAVSFPDLVYERAMQCPWL